MSHTQPSRRRGQERALRRGRILAAATRLFARRGLENVTFGDIAQKAGLSRPLVYFYFPDQRALFLEAVLEARSTLLNELTTCLDAVQAEGGAGMEQLEALAAAYARFQREKPDAFRISSLQELQPKNGRANDGALAQLLQNEIAIKRCFRMALAAGIHDASMNFQVGALKEVSELVWIWVHGMVESMSRETPIPGGTRLEVSEPVDTAWSTGPAWSAWILMLRRALGASGDGRAHPAHATVSRPTDLLVAPSEPTSESTREAGLAACPDISVPTLDKNSTEVVRSC